MTYRALAAFGMQVFSNKLVGKELEHSLDEGLSLYSLRIQTWSY